MKLFTFGMKYRKNLPDLIFRIKAREENVSESIGRLCVVITY